CQDDYICVALANFRGHEYSIRRHMQRRGFQQPDVPVNPRALVPPTFITARIDPHSDHVLTDVVQIIGEIVSKRLVPAGMAAQTVAVDPDDAVAEDAVEFDADTLAKIRFRNVERSPVPSDAVLGKIRADREAAVLDVLAV